MDNFGTKTCKVEKLLGCWFAIPHFWSLFLSQVSNILQRCGNKIIIIVSNFIFMIMV